MSYNPVQRKIDSLLTFIMGMGVIFSFINCGTEVRSQLFAFISPNHNFQNDAFANN